MQRRRFPVRSIPCREDGSRPPHRHSFANSIGPCAAPSCDGVTPRVVDSMLPNPAFPTYGDLTGGFEVHIIEGIAHVDVGTAEDNPDNQIAPLLLEFIDRNVQ